MGWGELLYHGPDPNPGMPLWVALHQALVQGSDSIVEPVTEAVGPILSGWLSGEIGTATCS